MPLTLPRGAQTTTPSRSRLGKSAGPSNTYRAATVRSCEKMGDARNREFRVNSGLTRGPRTRSERPSDDLASPNEPGWTASGIFSELLRERWSETRIDRQNCLSYL